MQVDARQKQFTLQETSLQVRVEGGKIQEIQVRTGQPCLVLQCNLL